MFPPIKSSKCILFCLIFTKIILCDMLNYTKNYISRRYVLWHL
nr:MAG TPA: hypothetical protein [Caudoviricetes sp.]